MSGASSLWLMHLHISLMAGSCCIKFLGENSVMHFSLDICHYYLIHLDSLFNLSVT